MSIKSSNYAKIILYLKRKEYFLISIINITPLHLFGVVFYKQTYSTHTYTIYVSMYIYITQTSMYVD